MQIEPRPSANTSSNSVRLGDHGYRIEGDTAILNAELVVQAGDLGASDRPPLALQLWACDAPYENGTLRGIKVAETQLASFSGERAQFESSAFAHLPPAQRDYSMVLVLASGDQGAYDQLQDFSNYAQRQQFAGPRLEGTVGYRVEGSGVLLQAERVRNTRPYDNLSGSLTLELWALSEAYEGGQLRGTILASTSLGRLEGQTEICDIERHAPLHQLAPGTWQVALVLTEFTSTGYATRDVSSFAAPYVVESPLARPSAPSEAPAALQTATVAAAPVATAASKDEPVAAKLAESPKATATRNAEATKPAAGASKPSDTPKVAGAAADKQIEASTVSASATPAAIDASKAAATTGKPADAAKPSDLATKDVEKPKLALAASEENEATKAGLPASAALVQSKDVQSKDAQSKDAQSKDAQSKDTQSKDAQSKGAQKAVAKETDAAKQAAVPSKDAAAPGATSPHN